MMYCSETIPFLCIFQQRQEFIQDGPRWSQILQLLFRLVCLLVMSLLYKLSNHIVSGLADHCINQLIQLKTKNIL